MTKCSAEDVKRLQEEGALILDVRPYAAFLEKHIKGAQSLPLEEIESAKIDKSKKIVVYCGGPTCPLSGFAFEKLKKSGFDVVHFHGGLEEWTNQGYPVE